MATLNPTISKSHVDRVAFCFRISGSEENSKSAEIFCRFGHFRVKGVCEIEEKRKRHFNQRCCRKQFKYNKNDI